MHPRSPHPASRYLLPAPCSPLPVSCHPEERRILTSQTQRLFFPKLRFFAKEAQNDNQKSKRKKSDCIITSMKPIEYERMFSAEDRHWWYQGMAVITRGILDRHLPPGQNREILDAGCGTGGAMASFLQDYGRVSGFDFSIKGLEFCKARELTGVFAASVTEIPLNNERFDLVTSFDVLYHVQDDRQAMREMARVLKPGGALLVRVPAYEWMRRQHDIQVSAVRRYTRQKVKALFDGCGFEAVRLTCANTFLFPLAVANVLLEKISPPKPEASELAASTGAFNHLFKAILSSEARLAARFLLPYGLSIFALGRKKADRS